MATILTNKIPQFSEAEYIRFWSKAGLTANPDICWEWNSTIRQKDKPYGRFEINKKVFSSSRVAYFLHNGNDPQELHVLHKCDNPKCVNPNHLFLGTNDDNVQDKVRKGRQARNVAWNKGGTTTLIGSKNPAAVLNEKKVIEIREMYAGGTLGAGRISKLYGVSKKLIQNIINGKIWKHI